MNINIIDLYKEKKPLFYAGVVILLLVIGGLYYHFQIKSSASATVNLTASPATAAVTTTPVMPKGYNENSVMRDPFAVPFDIIAHPEVKVNQQQTPKQPVSQPTVSVSKGNEQARQNAAKPLLKGVVTGDTDQVAIINFNGETNWYRIGTMIGPYKLLSIGDDSVTTWGPGGKLVLEVGK